MLPIDVIRESKPADPEDEREGDEDVVAALAEARRMAYVQGHWVYTENNQEVDYSLVHPSAVCLPAHGDYAAYTAWGKTTNLMMYLSCFCYFHIHIIIILLLLLYIFLIPLKFL